MGRTSKFTFPVPGRRAKTAPEAPLTAPMSKAQRVLGSAGINIDAPRQWDNSSTSGISISISESSASHAPSEMGNRPPKGGEGSDHPRSRRNWEVESEILPHRLLGGGAARSGKKQSLQARDFCDGTSEVSSALQRRQSTASTIRSWYDKTKMPLSISQQTSASAMAKGLPSRTNGAFDVGGMSPNSGKKKKPSRLDLSSLIPRHLHRDYSTQGVGPDAGRGLREQAMAPVPSGIVTPPPVRQRSSRLTRKATKERINELVASAAGSASTNRRGANSINGLHNLYDHYEQMSFRRMGKDFDIGDEDLSGSDPEACGADVAVTRQVPESRPSPRNIKGRGGKRYEHVDDVFDPDMPPTPGAIRIQDQLQVSPSTEYAASVSSRQTRGSRSSKRTNPSFMDSDLQQQSVLSLSSDSEGELFIQKQPRTSTSKKSDRQPEGDGSLLTSNRHRPASAAPSPRGPPSAKPTKRATFAPENTYLTIPDGPISVKSPTPNPRTSSLPPSALHSGPSSVRSTSRLSIMSTSTTASAMNWQNRPGFGIQEARVVAILPQVAYEAPQGLTSRAPEAVPLHVHAPQPRSPQRQTSGLLLTRSPSLHSTEQLTPPLSPTSVDFYMRSAASSIDPTVSHNPRFMAVTKQEEMLLAALRMKRARMRETILSEFQDEIQGGIQSRPPYEGRRASQSSGSDEDCDAPNPPKKLPRLTSNTFQNTTAGEALEKRPRGNSPLRGSSRGRRGGPMGMDPERPNTGHPDPMFEQAADCSIGEGARSASGGVVEERVLVYLDSPAGITNDTRDTTEPSPDLSDFMDFDDGTSEDEESGDLLFERGGFISRDLVAERTSSKPTDGSRSPGEEPRRGSPPLSPVGGITLERVYVVDEGEEDAGVPRPDSPISPGGPLPLSVHGKKAVRLSAVGRVGVEVTWWGDDG